MGNTNSKKSSADLAPGRKRLKMDESGATLDLKIGVKKETEDQRIQVESPAQKVLRLPELVSIIFGHLAADSDLKSLKNARVVCSLWKNEVFITLRNNLSLMPYIIVEHPASHSLADYLKLFRPHKSLQCSADSLMPGCDFPLKLAVNDWTPELESFIRDFSREIVRFDIFGIDQFDGFPAELGTIELTALRHTSFTADEICSEEKKRVEFVNALTFWKELFRASKSLKTNYFHLEICESDPLPPNNSAFDQIEWSEVNTLRCSYEFLALVCASNELSGLKELHCNSLHDKSKNEDDLVKQISLAKAPNLTKVELKQQVEWILDHQMSELEILTLEGVRISGRQPPCKLLPNLKEVYIYEDSMEGRPFDCLISGGGVFENVVELTLYESWMNLNGRMGDVAIQLCESFPNLKKLKWLCYNDESNDLDDDEEDNNNALYAAPIIFSKLEFLTSLEISIGWLAVSERKLVELLTGISLEDIPEEEESWPTALLENPHSISNVKHLNLFHLHIDEELVRVVARHGRFLFAAAFRTMDSLIKLRFGNIIFEDTNCATEWQQMGRMIQVEFTSGDEMHSDSSDFELEDD